MADSTFGFKSSKKETLSSLGGEVPIVVKNFTGSLALRVFLISVVCLVLPLIAYCFMMYRYDFDVKQAQQAQLLELVYDTQVVMIEHFVDFKIRALEQINFYLNSGAVAGSALSENLHHIARTGKIGSIFVLKTNDHNDAICTISSGEYQIGRAYNSLLFTSELKDSDYAVVLDDHSQKIYFVKVLQRSPDHRVVETLNLVVPTAFLISYITEAQGYNDVYKVLLFNQDSMIFDGEDPTFFGKKIIVDPLSSQDIKDRIVLKSIPMETDTYEYDVNGKTLYATILPVAQLNLNILIIRTEVKEAYYLREFFYQTILLFVLIIVLGGIGAIFLTYLMSKPLRNLCQVMTRVSNHDLSSRYEQSHYGFEINKVGEMFNTMIQRLLDHWEQLQEKTIQQEILQQELHIGQQIQKSLVPTELPEVPGIELETVLIPAKEVGGDFYDFFTDPTNPDEIILVIADTSGHGVFGCFYSLTMRSILRGIGSTVAELQETIVKANALFCKDSAISSVFVTAWIGSYNHKTHLLRYSSCGHPLGYVFRNHKFIKELATPGIALGVVEEMDPVIDSFQLEPGDTVILITDGVIETHNPDGKLYGKERFIKAVETYCHLPVKKLCEEIVNEVESFEVNSENQHDDFTMVILRIK